MPEGIVTARRGGTRQTSVRAGRYVPQPTGYSAFVPAPFPPTDLELDPRLVDLLERATLALGKLVGSGAVLPDPDLFVWMYVRREAVLSSQIEGTEASLIDLLEWEVQQKRTQRRGDVREITNYISALRYGLGRVKELPVSLRLIREIHESLMTGVRGGESSKTPGEFRKSQNWVGGPSPTTARYVPPPVDEMHRALDEFEKSLHASSRLPVLLRIGLAHAQFETIHPFLDGNGRVGRLLITFLLIEEDVLTEPLLYLSIYFKRHRQEYYDRLQDVRDRGDWEGWLAFFLEGVKTVSDEALSTAQKIVRLREEKRQLIADKLGRRASNGQQLLEGLFRRPYINVGAAEEITGLSQPAANSLVNEMEKIGLLTEVTGRKRYRMFEFSEYMRLFDERDRRG